MSNEKVIIYGEIMPLPKVRGSLLPNTIASLGDDYLDIKSEVINARIGRDGTQYDSLGKHIRSIGGGGLTTAQINALDGLFKLAAYTADASAAYAAFLEAFSSSGEEPEEPEVPDEPIDPGVTLTSIFVKYSGGDVEVGTALTDLKGIVVTATYSDGNFRTVTGYTLSGTIAEGVNIITVSYGGLTATFTVTGYVQIVTYNVTNNLTNVTNSNSQTEVTEGFYSATLTVEDGFMLNSVVITMGGVDVTDSVYTADTGSILITEVTGDIVITAVASELEEIPLTVQKSRYLTIYSDDGTTQIFKNYTDAFYSVNSTETDANVVVEITNSSDSSWSRDVYIGCDGVHYAIKKTVALNSGESARYEYTVKAGKALAVCVGNTNAATTTVRAYGSLDVYQPTAEYAVTSKQFTTIKTYSDGTTDNLLKSANYQYVVSTTETFAEDTDLIISLANSGDSVATISGTEWYFGSVDPANLATVYYGVMGGGSNTLVGVGQVIKKTYTVKAGYAFAIANVTNALTADMVFVEKA